MREKEIIKVSVIAIIANVFLSIFKTVVGFLSSSISIIMDAVNNLTDALSSIITIIGTKLSNKRPDRDHPYGFGRVEFITSSIISMLVLYAGITSLVESVKNIINPQKPSYSLVSLIIVAVAVLIKFLLGVFVKNKGENLESGALIASGEDSKMDSIISLSTLIAALLYKFTGLSLESYLAFIISIFIIKSGIDLLKEALSKIIGERIDKNLAQDLKEYILKYEKVQGVYDLVLSAYGPKLKIGSLHIEVSNKITIDELDILERKIAEDVYRDFSIALTGISIYSINETDDYVQKLFKDVRKIVGKYDNILQVHGFNYMEDENTINFDIVVDYAQEDVVKLCQSIKDDVKKAYPDKNVNITIDMDTADIY